MKTGKEKELDDLFRQGLNNPSRIPNFREDDWDAMEAMLDKNEKRGDIVYWLPLLSSVAAVLLLVLAFFVLRHNDTPALVNNSVKQPVHAGSASSKSTQLAVKQSTSAPVTGTIAQTVNAPIVSASHSAATDKPVTKYAVNRQDKNHNKNVSVVSVGGSETSHNNDLVQNSILGTSTEIIAANIPALEVLPVNNVLTSDATLPDIDKGIILPASKTDKKVTIKKTYSNRPQFAITVMASPDINGVGSFQNGKVGTNAGLLFSVGVTKKFTVSTGAIYSKKPYVTDFNNYHTAYQFKTDPLNVTADCRVLDIPINVDYQLYSKAKNKFSIGSGLSSYIMLRENYHYNYDYPGTPGPTDFTVVNKNQHILGVLNLDATFQHQLNSKLSLGIEPYLKVPLTDIGNSEVRLQSTGVAVGLTWNINTAHNH